MTLVVITEEKPETLMKDSDIARKYAGKLLTPEELNDILNQKPKEIREHLRYACICRSIVKKVKNHKESDFKASTNYWFNKYEKKMNKINQIRMKIWQFN